MTLVSLVTNNEIIQDDLNNVYISTVSKDKRLLINVSELFQFFLVFEKISDDVSLPPDFWKIYHSIIKIQ